MLERINQADIDNEKINETETQETAEAVEEVSQETAEKDTQTDEQTVIEEKVVTPVQEKKITEEDVKEFEKELSLGDAFMRRTITIPGKRKQRAAFRDDEEIIGDDTGEIDTFGSLKRREYEMLSDSAKATKPKVLYGRIDGVEEIGEGELKIPTAVCHLITDKRADINKNEMTSGIYKIVIPAPALFIYNQADYEGPEGYRALKRKIEMRAGSVVEFIVYDINMNEERVLASRVNAMQLLSYDYYLSKKAVIEPGKKAKGYITYINSSGIAVDVFGAECFINANELSWKYIANPLHEKSLYIGKPVAVRIKSVEKDSTEIFGQKFPFIKITGSIKDATENPNKLFYERYVLGQKYVGEVAFRLSTGEYIVNLGSKGDGMDGNRCTVICKAPAIELGGTPFIGQNCMVAITRKDDKDYRLTGVFTYLEPSGLSD